MSRENNDVANYENSSLFNSNYSYINSDNGTTPTNMRTPSIPYNYMPRPQTTTPLHLPSYDTNHSKFSLYNDSNTSIMQPAQPQQHVQQMQPAQPQQHVQQMQPAQPQQHVQQMQPAQPSQPSTIDKIFKNRTLDFNNPSTPGNFVPVATQSSLTISMGI